jgi:hypothetical protein
VRGTSASSRKRATPKKTRSLERAIQGQDLDRPGMLDQILGSDSAFENPLEGRAIMVGIFLVRRVFSAARFALPAPLPTVRPTVQ